MFQRVLYHRAAGLIQAPSIIHQDRGQFQFGACVLVACDSCRDDLFVDLCKPVKKSVEAF
jgi:hypothetical protein